ncbi:hypothetical protein ABT186_02235 [Streptomyces sp. NPDC001634]|uniref:hypothetical protein n=1 Tax=Streptomyces sp. NPDC001634 TaxID=3154390 RepID=UPI00331E3357
MTKTYWLDMVERVGATAGEAALGLAITEFSSLPMWWAALLVPVLSAAKGALARYVGDPSSASLLRRKPSMAPVPDPPDGGISSAA